MWGDDTVFTYPFWGRWQPAETSATYYAIIAAGNPPYFNSYSGHGSSVYFICEMIPGKSNQIMRKNNRLMGTLMGVGGGRL